MIAEKCEVVVEADLPGGGHRSVAYIAGDVKQMCRSLFHLAETEPDEKAQAFYQGFAACLDVMASGLLSATYVQGSAYRALVDVADPHNMPGEITDVGRYALEDEAWWRR